VIERQECVLAAVFDGHGKMGNFMAGFASDWLENDFKCQFRDYCEDPEATIANALLQMD
jgi:serine/threonine protein phosphatase PrpC